jgi:MFS family permease
MPDAEQDFNGQHGLLDGQATGETGDLDEGEKLQRSSSRSAHQRDTALLRPPPRGRVIKALLIGGIAGVLSIAQSIVITFANAPTYHAYDLARDQAVKNSLAFTILGYAALTFFITMLICFVAGYIAGRVCLQRRLGFLAGFVVGIVNDGASFITHYIPNYPGNQQSAAGGINNAAIAIGGIAVFLTFLLVWGILTGLVGLLGAWVATRRHPGY